MIKINTEVHLDSRLLDNMVRNSNELGIASTHGISWKIILGCRRRSRVRTGDMKAGWKRLRVGKRGYIIYNEMPYMIYNEYGTARMSAKPMLTPSFNEVQGQFPEEVAKYMKLSATTDLAAITATTGGMV